MAAEDTRHAILDAAETLLGEVGFAAMSLRQLTSRANVNLAGVHYHFGSKEDLAQAVLSRRIGPVNAERLRRLDLLEQRAHGAPIALADVVAAFLAPALELATDGDRRACTMIGRILAEQPPFLRSYLAEQFGVVADRFVRTLMQSVPGLSRADGFWRLHFMVGAMSHTMQHGATMQAMTNGACATDRVDETVRQLTAFCAAGLAAPAAVATGSAAPADCDPARRPGGGVPTETP